MSMELDALRKRLDGDMGSQAPDAQDMEVFQARETELTNALVDSKQQQAELQTVLDVLKKREGDLLESLKQAEEWLVY